MSQNKRVETLKERVKKTVDEIRPEIERVNRYIHENPELCFQEFRSSARIAEFLKGQGFEVKLGVGGLKTAFEARAEKRRKKGPAICYVAEYDALPEIGHACGHNLIASASCAAAVALSKIYDGDAPGSVVVIGTPAEEGGGGKVMLIDKGLFRGIDAAMMAHPSNKTRVVCRMLAVSQIDFTFLGKASHAAAFPHLGVNALDALILFYNNVGLLRQQLKDDVRIHGIITEGGAAPNIIPERATGRFMVRSLDLDYFREVLEKVKECARGAARATGCRVAIRPEKIVYHPFQPNYRLGGLFRDNLHSLGIRETHTDETASMGSSDIGNVSQILPTIHPEFSIVDDPTVINHSRAFTQQAISKKGVDRMIDIAKTLAMTGIDLLEREDQLAEVKREF
jgi:amidohydrolase